MNSIRFDQTETQHGFRLPFLGPPFRKNSSRPLHGLPETLGRVGNFEFKIARTKKEIRMAQKLRWRVFYEQGNAQSDPMTRLRRRDICPFDAMSDHLIVLDHSAKGRRGKIRSRVVGTYRLLRQDNAHNGFYSASEFDVEGLLARHPGKIFLELGRSCILPEYRSKRVLELLWRGIWIYALHHRIDVMIGCASLPGVVPSAQEPILSYIHNHATATGLWSVPVVPGRNLAIADFCAESEGNKKIRVSIPPLVKGYLRLGARFGEGLFIDRQFGTTDIFVILPVAEIDQRYIDYFSAPVS